MNTEILLILKNSPYYSELVSLGILIGSIIFAKIFYFFLERYVRALARKIKSQVDDMIVAVIEKPVFISIVSIGIYFALQRLPIFSTHTILLSQIFVVLGVGIGLWLFLRLTNIGIDWYVSKGTPEMRTKIGDVAPTIKKVIMVFVAFIGLVMILGVLRIEITPLLASLGIVGLAIALAFQDTLSNFFAGIYISAERPIKVGDYIELEQGQKGYVVEIGWRSTRIRTLPGNIIVIPNTKLAQSIVTNYYAPQQKMAVVIPVSVAYSSDLENVEKVTVDIAKKIMKTIPGGVKDFEPFIRYGEFGDSGINFSVIIQVEKFVDKYLVIHEFIKALIKRYNKEKITIPFPQRDVWMRKR